MNKIWLIPIIAGLLIELFFRLIKYRDEMSKRGPVAKYRPYNNYIEVDEFVAGGHRRWWRYILFRSFPPLIMLLLLSAIYQNYFPDRGIYFPIILAAIISLLPRDIYPIFRKVITFSEKIVHLINILFVAIVVLIVSAVAHITSVKFLAPSLNGVVDNLWASLFVATLVVFYLDATNQGNIIKQEFEEENRRSNCIITIYNKVRERFNESIIKYCEDQKCSIALLYAILIYEDMNRPTVIRIVENFLVRLFSLELTVGIAQVKSRKPLTDEKSIEIAAQELKDTEESVKESFNSSRAEFSNIKEIIKKYNSNTAYADSIIQILSTLKSYASSIFNS